MAWRLSGGLTELNCILTMGDMRRSSHLMTLDGQLTPLKAEWVSLGFHTLPLAGVASSYLLRPRVASLGTYFSCTSHNSSAYGFTYYGGLPGIFLLDTGGRGK